MIISKFQSFNLGSIITALSIESHWMDKANSWSLSNEGIFMILPPQYMVYYIGSIYCKYTVLMAVYLQYILWHTESLLHFGLGQCYTGWFKKKFLGCDKTLHDSVYLISKSSLSSCYVFNLMNYIKCWAINSIMILLIMIIMLDSLHIPGKLWTNQF